MKHLKLFELFKKKPKERGNYLSKQDQPEPFNPYLYNDPFNDNGKFYICCMCDSNKLTPTALGGMQPPRWKCDNCGELNYAPKYMSPERYIEYLEEQELKKATNKYNL